MMHTTCPTPEELFERLAANDVSTELHLGDCPACAALLEVHRELEKDLYRIQDPLPPADLVPSIMARIEAAPVPAARELRRVLAIAGPVFMVLLAMFLIPATQPMDAAGDVSSTLFGLRTFLLAMVETTITIWRAAALPITLTLGSVLMLAILGLWRLSGVRPTEASAS